MQLFSRETTDLTTAIIVHDYGNIRGGQEKVAIESALGLKAAGLDVAFFCPVGPVDERLFAAGIRVECLNLPDLKSNPSKVGAAIKGIWNPITARGLQSVLKDYDPKKTIVHAHGWSKALSPSIGPILASMPHVYTMHEYFLACPNGGFFNYGKDEICKLKPLSPQCLVSNCDQRSYREKLFRIARQMAARHVGHLPGNLRNVIYISELQKSVMKRYLPTLSTLHHVPNPVSIIKSPRVKAEDNDYVLFVGRLEPVKGALDLATVASQINLPIKFVGDGSDAEKILELYPDADITGWVSPNEVYDYIRKSRCLAFLSHWYECQPLVPYEALAMGVPVLSYDASAARECVVPGVNGEIISFEARFEMLPKILKAYETDSVVAERSSAAYNRYWESPLTTDKHISELIAVYSRILAQT